MKKIMSVMAVLFVLIARAYSSVNVYHDSPYVATVHVVHQYWAGSMLFSSGEYQSSEEDLDYDMPSGGLLELQDASYDLGPYLDGDNWVQLREEWTYYCFSVQLYSNGGGGGGGDDLPYDDVEVPVRQGGEDLFTYPSNALLFSYNRAEFENKLGELMGTPLTPEEKILLDAGCIGVTQIATRWKRANGTMVFLKEIGLGHPELNRADGRDRDKFGEAKGFRTLEQAQAGSPGPGRHRVIFVKIGAWKNNTPPVDIAGGEPGQIPSDSVVDRTTGSMNFNYVTLINGKWVHLNFGVNAGPGAQEGWMSDTPPESALPMIFIRRDIANQ